MAARAPLPVVALFAAALAGVAPSAACAASAADPCPASEMSFNGIDLFTSTAAVFDSSVGSGARVAYDLPHGTVEVLHCCGLGVGYTTARDAFDVAGVAPGTAVPVVAELWVDGWIISLGCGASGCFGYLTGGITTPTDANSIVLAEHLYEVARVPVSGVVRLPVTLVAGQPQVLEFRLSARKAAGGNHGAEGIGRIRFAGLPVGARVVSCNGYDSVAVPVRPASWGRVKAVYR